MNTGLEARLAALAAAGELDTLPLVDALNAANAGQPAISLGGSPAPTLASELSTATVFSVGHSLISHRDSRVGSSTIPEVLDALCTAATVSHTHYLHNFAGAPMKWTWGASATSWADVGTSLQELVDSGGANYGIYDVLVCTEGAPLLPSVNSQETSFFFRRFCGAALNANPACRLFLYETWPHFQAGDDQFAGVGLEYGPRVDFDFVPYSANEQALWTLVRDRAADPALTVAPPGDYVWQGAGSDPGELAGDPTLTINVIPGGTAIRALIARMLERRSTDDWSYADAFVGDEMKPMDLFQNPYTGFPGDVTTTALGGAVDDIHQSRVLAYLIACLWYACIYRRSPVGLPTANGIPAAIAAIFQAVAWEVATTDTRTGVTV